MNEKRKRKNSGAGFYIALCCCVAAIGIVGFINSEKKQHEEPITLNIPTIYPTAKPLPTPSEAVDLIPYEEAAEAVSPKIVEKKVVETPEPTEYIPDKSSENTDIIEAGENEDFYDGEIVESISIAKQPKFVMPAEGTIVCGFSGDKLYYDSVMGDFRTHNGIDIAAPADSEVVAAYDGTIDSVYTDTLGKTVILNHGNGFMTKYSNLDDIENLSVGMELKQGDFIAHVGTYQYGENTTEPHLHFEIIRDGEFVDPELFIK